MITGKRLLWLFISVFILGLVLSGCDVTEPDTSTETYTISGEVEWQDENEEELEPESTSIELRDSEGEKVKTVELKEGKYSFDNVESGTYSVELPDYEDEEIKNQEEMENITVDDEDISIDPIIIIVSSEDDSDGSIAVIVEQEINEDGDTESAEKIDLELLKEDDEDFSSEGTTNKDGNYTFKDLEAGQYEIKLLEYEDEQLSGNYKEIELGEEDTKEVEITIDFEEPEPETGSIVGDISWENNDGEEVEAQDIELTLGEEEKEPTSLEDSSYSFEDLQPGKYELNVNDLDEDAELDEEASDDLKDIEVTAGQEEPVNLVIVVDEEEPEPKGTIKGNITWVDEDDNSVDAEDYGISLELFDGEESVDDLDNKSEKYKFEEVESGTYALELKDLQEGWNAGAADDGESLENIDIGAGEEETRDIKIILSENNVEGTLYLEGEEAGNKGKVIGDETVTLVDASESVIEPVDTNEEGVFEFESVLPGEYGIEFEDPVAESINEEASELEFDVKGEDIDDIEVFVSRDILPENLDGEKLDVELDDETIEGSRFDAERADSYEVVIERKFDEEEIYRDDIDGTEFDYTLKEDDYGTDGEETFVITVTPQNKYGAGGPASEEVIYEQIQKINDAKDLVNDVQDSLCLLEAQQAVLDEAEKEVLEPRMEASNERMKVIGRVFEMIAQVPQNRELVQDEYVIYPGEFTLDYNAFADGKDSDEWLLEEPDYGEGDVPPVDDYNLDSDWEYVFKIENILGDETHIVKLNTINFRDLFSTGDNALDFALGTDIYFEYTQTSEDNPSLNWNLGISYAPEGSEDNKETIYLEDIDAFDETDVAGFEGIKYPLVLNDLNFFVEFDDDYGESDNLGSLGGDQLSISSDAVYDLRTDPEMNVQDLDIEADGMEVTADDIAINLAEFDIVDVINGSEGIQGNGISSTGITAEVQDIFSLTGEELDIAMNEDGLDKIDFTGEYSDDSDLLTGDISEFLKEEEAEFDTKQNLKVDGGISIDLEESVPLELSTIQDIILDTEGEISIVEGTTVGYRALEDIGVEANIYSDGSGEYDNMSVDMGLTAQDGDLLFELYSSDNKLADEAGNEVEEATLVIDKGNEDSELATILEKWEIEYNDGTSDYFSLPFRQ
ncbi:MAG: MSCRAMM family protein [Halanaerobiales bacterium]